MWSFSKSGDLLYERALEEFLKKLFEKWRNSHATHSVTVILYTRTLILEKNTEEEKNNKYQSQDFMKVLLF